MRKLLSALLFVVFFSLSLHAQKTRLGQAEPQAASAVPVHVSGSHLGSICSGAYNNIWCSSGLYVEAILNGKKVEFFGESEIEKIKSVVLIPGDYQAKLTKNAHNADSTAIDQEYDIVLPDGAVWHCTLTGISE